MNFLKRLWISVSAALGSKSAKAIEHDTLATLAPIAEAALGVAASSNALAAAAVAGVIDPAINRVVKATDNTTNG